MRRNARITRSATEKQESKMASAPPDPHPDSPPTGPSDHPDQLTDDDPGRTNVEQPAEERPQEG